VTVDQALTFADALASGDPHRIRIAPAALSDKVRELV
jgi:hypothetical protein